MKNAGYDGPAPVANSGELDNRRNSAPVRSPATHHHRNSDRTHEPRRAALDDAITIVEWKKNRRGESIKVQIKPFEDAVLLDLRTWYGKDGYRKPGKGFAATVSHLPAPAAAFRKAGDKARELGLLDDGGAQ
jgi:hypothetical protein